MSDFTSDFWNLYVAALTLVSIIACLILLWIAGTTKAATVHDNTTGHVWDGDLREINNPLPKWWVYLFIITCVFGLAYGALYPMFGKFQGVLGWFMVASGLVDRPSVSHYRLAAHLLVWGVWLFVSLVTARNGGVDGPNLLNYPVLIVLSGDQIHGPAWAGEALAGLAFLMTGVGMHMTQTAGLALASDRALSRLAGMNDHVGKPFVLDQLVAAHGNSLRALYKYLNNVSREEILELNIPTGIPLLFELNDDLTVQSFRYLGDPEAARKAAEAVANQGKAK